MFQYMYFFFYFVYPLDFQKETSFGAVQKWSLTPLGQPQTSSQYRDSSVQWRDIFYWYKVFLAETAEGELESDEDGDQLSIYEQKNRRRKNNAQQQTDEGKLLSFAK